MLTANFVLLKKGEFAGIILFIVTLQTRTWLFFWAICSLPFSFKFESPFGFSDCHSPTRLVECDLYFSACAEGQIVTC